MAARAQARAVAVPDATARSMTEAHLLRNVRDLAKLLGFWTMHQLHSRGTQPGWPDLVLAHPTTGRFLLRELKTESGRLTEDQEQVLLLLGCCGLDAGVWRPRDWLDGTIEHELLAASGRAAA